MKILFVLIFTIMTGFLNVSAENIITGSVVQTSDNSPISGVNILIKDDNGKILAYGVSTLDGHFSIKLSSTSEKLFISAAMIGYKSYSASLALDGKPLVIKMEKGALQLQEVVVKANRIRENGDTITYTVNK